MLEFIVLGQIPGTEMYLPFTVTIAIVAAVCVLTIAVFKRRSVIVVQYKKRLQQITDIAL